VLAQYGRVHQACFAEELAGIIVMGLCYAGCSLARGVVPAVILLAVAMLAGGFVFPVLMNQLQSYAGNARGTVSSLASTAMYLGTTISGAVGGTLLTRFSGFTGISVFITASFIVALGCYAVAGAFTRHPTRANSPQPHTSQPLRQMGMGQHINYPGGTCAKPSPTASDPIQGEARRHLAHSELCG